MSDKIFKNSTGGGGEVVGGVNGHSVSAGIGGAVCKKRQNKIKFKVLDQKVFVLAYVPISYHSVM